MAEKTNVFQFMVIRAPAIPSADAARRGYVRDDALGANGRRECDLFTSGSDSEIGKLINRIVFCSDDDPAFTPDFEYILSSLLPFLSFASPSCGDDENGAGLGLELLLNRHYFELGGRYYFIPDRLSDLSAPLLAFVVAARRALDEALADAAAKTAPLDVPAVRASLKVLLDGSTLVATIFNAKGSGASSNFLATKRALFDALYLLYILRRRLGVTLEHVISGLQTMHALEALAVDEAVAALQSSGPHSTAEQRLLTVLQAAYPSLQGWSFKSGPDGFPLIADAGDLEAYVGAAPVVHPLFAQLHRFRTPFNPIRPLGIGDLKVVKQWLCGYKVGEIAHVENVLKSEERTRVHRHLDKTEDTFSYLSDQQSETQQDTQSTDRFELKRETESLAKEDLNVNASLNLSLTYKAPAYTIVSTVSGGFAYNRSQSEQVKAASNFAREVVDKAVKRVQSRVSEQRSTTKLFETEETNTHSFDNKLGEGHISGIYRWLDKEYRAQIYNYGKRLMFEFLVPEPAAFLVESRLRAFEESLDLPQPPKEPVLATLPKWLQKLSSSDITEARFKQLRRQYDLSDLSYPALTKTVDLVDAQTGQNVYSALKLSNERWDVRSFTCRAPVAGYEIAELTLEGHVGFSGASEGANLGEQNTFELYVGGQRLVQKVDNTVEGWYFGSGSFPGSPSSGGTAPAATNLTGKLQGGLYTFQPGETTPFATDEVSLSFGFLDGLQFELSVQAKLRLSAAALDRWQASVYETIRKIEQKNVDDRNHELEQSYQSQRITYQNRLAEFRAVAVNDLLQGRSGAANSQLILRELKRQCLAMLTKDFDAEDPSDDTLTGVDAQGKRHVLTEYRRLVVSETPAAHPVSTTASFDRFEQGVDFPAPSIDVAKAKGRYVQFLEQAFEWNQLAYNCYPYFWAVPPRWIELMNRGDDVDPDLSAFLQAGYAKIVIAVTTGYDDAVVHYLETGEPWAGGLAPVIGDPLYIPLYEELRKEQDDLHGAVAEGDVWPFTLPTSLVYLESSSTPLPPSEC